MDTEETKEKTVETDEPTHPLFIKRLRSLDWQRWQELWAEADSPELLQSLLHIIFDTRPPWPGAVDLLLGVADGYASGTNFTRGRRFVSDQGGKVIAGVARKAMKVLCTHWFSKHQTVDYSNAYHFWDDLLGDGVFQSLLWFLDDYWPNDEQMPSKDSRRWLSSVSNLPSHPDTYHQRVIRAFALELIRKTWSLNRNEWMSCELDDIEGWQAVFTAARPAYVRMLDRLGEIDQLAGFAKDMDEAALAELHRLAMSRQAGKTPPETIDESAWRGNQAACVYLVVQAVRAEAKRQERIKEAEYRKQQAERELEAARKA